MKNFSNNKTIRLAAAFLVPALCLSMLSAPVLAQPGVRRPGPPPGYRPYGPPPPPPRRVNDLDKALAIVGTVGAIATIANSRNHYYYYRQPAIVVAPPHPTVVVSRPPMVVEKPVIVERPVIIEKPVVIEQQVPTVLSNEGSYSSKLGAFFRIENMEIPGYRFTAARLTSEPTEKSPLRDIGLRKGDVITRLDDTSASTLAELDRHTGSTPIRYIKTGTTKVLLANIYIPRDTDGGTYHAP